MPKANSDYLTWNQFSVISGIVVIVIGGGFYWLHDDMSNVRSSVDSVKDQVTAVREGVATTNGKLEIIIDELKKRK